MNPKEPHLYDDGGKNLPICKLCFHSRSFRLHISEDGAGQAIPGNAGPNSSQHERTSNESENITPLQAAPSFQSTFPVGNKDGLTKPEKLESLSHKHICQSCGRPEVHLNRELCLWPDATTCPACAERNSRTLPDQIFAEAIIETERLINPDIKCPGHPCSACGLEWLHDYTCKKDKGIDALCQKCAGQAGADAFRHTAISKMEKYQNGFITGSDAVQIRIAANEFAIKNFIKDELGNDRADWQERMSAHILGLEILQEKVRIELSEYHVVSAKERAKNAEKLTPEELSEYRKVASKPFKEPKKKVSKHESDEQADKDFRRKAWLAQRESIAKDIMTVKKKLSKEQAIVQAEKFLESQQEFVDRKEDSI